LLFGSGDTVRRSPVSEEMATERGVELLGAPSSQLVRAENSTHDTTEASIGEVYNKLKATFATGRTKSYEWRMQQLRGMVKMMEENVDIMAEALAADLGRPRFEAILGESGPVVTEAKHAMENLSTWMKPQKEWTGLATMPASSEVVKEPKGIVLNIAPWNYPINLPLCGTIAAIAAGNCCVIKPSELASACEKLFAEMIPKYLDSSAIAVVTGAIPETTALLKLKWDHIFYTGNGMVGKIVARAAAEHLTPITLELGGKSPVLVLPGADLKLVSKRLMHCKCLNAGQTCVAPDYVLVHASIQDALITECKTRLQEFYGDDTKTKGFGRVINDRHWNRIKKLIDTSGGEVYSHGGSPDVLANYIPPTLVNNPLLDSDLMADEIFGPVLAFIKMGSLGKMIEYVNAHDKPLALYIFGPNRDVQEVIAKTSSGGVCVNDCIFHILNSYLPFGGVGDSGHGKYHGKWGFDEFSHQRGVMYRHTFLDPSERYPPYTEKNTNLFQMVLVGPCVDRTWFFCKYGCLLIFIAVAVIVALAIAGEI